MNILPYKSWHVRTKKNIARVRRDEAKAAEEEKEVQRKIALAAQEARTAFLRERAKQRLGEEEEEEAKAERDDAHELTDVFSSGGGDIVQTDGHINFFQEIEQGIKQKYQTNIEHEEEKKKEQEEYEKKIGYLTYLGQNSYEQTKQKPWYADLDRPNSSRRLSSKCEMIDDEKQVGEFIPKEDKEVDLKKLKDFHDPLKDIRKYLRTPGVLSKMEKASSSSSKRQCVEKEESHIKSKKPKKEMKKKLKKEKKRHRNHKQHHKHKKNSNPRQLSSKRKSSSSSSSSSSGASDNDSDSEEKAKKEKLAKLRADRLEREKEERLKAEKLMAKFRGEDTEEKKPKSTSSNIVNNSSIKQKYNSQFNPHLARQNFDNN